MKNKILSLAKNGYISLKEIRENNIPSIYVSRMVKDGILNKVAPGIYTTFDIIEDMFYIYSLQYKTIVYDSHTAVYLNNLTNRQFEKIEVILPHHSNTKYYPFKVRVSRNKTFYETGISYVETPYGNMVRCYDKERCICNLFLYNDFDEEEKSYIIREYRDKYMNKEKLYEYAEKLGCLKDVKNVIEVIIWE